VASHGSWIPVEHDGKTSVNKKTKFTRALSLAMCFVFFVFWLLDHGDEFNSTFKKLA
jgi:hypothetical protein